MQDRSEAPVLSFGLPVRNGAAFLRRTLESLETQDFRDVEVVVCDNQSTDETGAIVKEFASRDPRFKYYLNETNIGQIENFNRVFELTNGRYFRWIGSDDWLDPSYARRCVEAL
jgi:glycosyltransferase involved in cell wall biosynthesis